jgi:hypothetical protein
LHGHARGQADQAEQEERHKGAQEKGNCERRHDRQGYAEMDVKPPPPDVSDLLAPTWVWLVSVLGAFAAYLEDFKPEDSWKIRTFKAVARLSSSALAAILTFNALLGLGVPRAIGWCWWGSRVTWGRKP